MKTFSRKVALWCVAFPASALVSLSAVALIKIRIDLSSQQMVVQGRGTSMTFPISSAREGYKTPRGTFRPQRMTRMHHSKKYHNSPMPHAIFFTGGYAIHGTYAEGSLGRPASHGCVRLSRRNAAILYEMVQDEGARISIVGSPYAGHLTRSARRHDLAPSTEWNTPALAYAQKPHIADGQLLRHWFRHPAR